jgi:hypothetical protein
METPILVTRRQLEVLLAIGQLGSTKLVARALGLSPHTVRAHLAALRERTGKGSAIEMLDLYRGLLVVEPEPVFECSAPASWRELIPLGSCVTFTHYSGETPRLSVLSPTAAGWLGEAAKHLDGGQLWEALRANEAGRAAFPEDGELLLQAAELYQRDGQWGRARDCLEGLVGRLEGRGPASEAERWLGWRAKRALGCCTGGWGIGRTRRRCWGRLGRGFPKETTRRGDPPF